MNHRKKHISSLDYDAIMQRDAEAELYGEIPYSFDPTDVPKKFLTSFKPSYSGDHLSLVRRIYTKKIDDGDQNTVDGLLSLKADVNRKWKGWREYQDLLNELLRSAKE